VDAQDTTGERSMFLDLKPLEGGAIAFIDNVLYVEVLKYNLLNLSQFYESGYIVSFDKDKCIVKTEDNKSFFTTKRHNNLYEIDLIDLSKQNVTCLYPEKMKDGFGIKNFDMSIYNIFQNYPKRI